MLYDKEIKFGFLNFSIDTPLWNKQRHVPVCFIPSKIIKRARFKPTLCLISAKKTFITNWIWVWKEVDKLAMRFQKKVNFFSLATKFEKTQMIQLWTTSILSTDHTKKSNNFFLFIMQSMTSQNFFHKEK